MGSQLKPARKTDFRRVIPDALKNAIINADPLVVTPPKTYVVIGADTVAAKTPIKSPPPAIQMVFFLNKPHWARNPVKRPITVEVIAYHVAVGSTIAPAKMLNPTPVKAPAQGPHSTLTITVPIESRYKGSFIRATKVAIDILMLIAKGIKTNVDAVKSRFICLYLIRPKSFVGTFQMLI